MSTLSQTADHPISSMGIRLSQRSVTYLMLLVYIGLAVFMTWPVASQLTTHLAGGRADLMTHQWTFWWVKQALTQGVNPFYTTSIFYPDGVTLQFHNIAWFNILLWIPLQAVLGNIAAYNLIFIATFALNAFATFLLAREWTKEFWPAFVGGLVWGFWPTIQSHYDHPNMIMVFSIPLTLLYLKRALEGGRTRDAVIAGVFMGLTGVIRLHLLIMGGVLLALFVLSKLLDRTYRTWRTVKRLVLIGVVAGVILAPFALPIVIGQIARAHPQDIFVDVQSEGQTDLMAYLTPPPHHPLATDVTRAAWYHFGLNQKYFAFIGYTTLALALYGAVRCWRQARFWSLAALVYVAIALGPDLLVNGQAYPDVLMPYRLVEGVFEILRKPDRFNVVLGLPIAMLAAYGVQALLQQRRVRLRPAFVGLVAAALILIEYRQTPYPSFVPTTPTWFSQLAQEPGAFAILDLPMDLGGANKWYMFYQSTHGKPLVEGRVSRMPREAFTFMNSSPLLDRLRRSNEMNPALTDVSRQLRQLSEAGVRYLVLHKRFAKPDQLAAWRDWLTVVPYREDDELIVYRTDFQVGRDFKIDHFMTDDLGLIRASFAPASVKQAAVLQIDARWGSRTSPDRDYDVCATLVNAAGRIGQMHCEPVVNGWSTSEWGANGVARGAYSFEIDPFLEPGVYSVRLTLIDEASGSPQGQPYEIGKIQMEEVPRDFALPQLSHPVDAHWDDALTLLGADMLTSPEALTLTLDWQANRRMSESYKVFVHVVDAASGAIVAQDDSVPRRWSYPTNWWEQGEVVSDTITIPVDQVAPGHYEVKVGVYHPSTGQRLPVYTMTGERYPDDVVPLTTFER